MRCFGFLFLLGACAASPQKLVDRAVVAHGGDKLGTVQSYHLETEGTYQGLPYTSLSHLRRPGDWRWQMTAGDMQMSMWVLGDEAYTATSGRAARSYGQEREEAFGHRDVAATTLLVDRLQGRDVTITETPPVEIDGKKHPAVIARFGGHGPATYCFDPDTHLLRAVRFKMTDTNSGKVHDGVTLLSNYEDMDGIRIATKIETTIGPWTISESITSCRWNPAMANDILARPDIPAQAAVTVRPEPEIMVAVYTFVGPYNEVGTGVQTVMAWLGGKGLQPAGPIGMIYPTEDGTMKTVLHVPVATTESIRPTDGVRVSRRRAFRYAFVNYDGPANACYTQGSYVLDWIERNGYRRTGSMRVNYMGQPDEAGNVKAEVGFPVRKK